VKSANGLSTHGANHQMSPTIVSKDMCANPFNENIAAHAAWFFVLARKSQIKETNNRNSHTTG
jgi:hypothetical protein